MQKAKGLVTMGIGLFGIGFSIYYLSGGRLDVAISVVIVITLITAGIHSERR